MGFADAFPRREIGRSILGKLVIFKRGGEHQSNYCLGYGEKYGNDSSVRFGSSVN